MIKKESLIKDLIVEILTENYPLTIKEIYRIIKKDYKRDVSYQGVYKIIFELLEKNVIAKEQKGYLLSKDYIERLNLHINKINLNYNKGEGILSELEQKGFIIKKLNNQYEMIYFILDILKKIKKGELLTISWTTTWPPLIIEDIHKIFIGLEKKLDAYCISYGDGFLDKKFAKHWRELGMKIKLGIKMNKMYETFAFEDKVMIIYQSPEKRVQKYRYINLIKGLTTLDRDNFFMKLFKEKLDIYVLIIKNPELADKIKQEIISYF